MDIECLLSFPFPSFGDEEEKTVKNEQGPSVVHLLFPCEEAIRDEETEGKQKLFTSLSSSPRRKRE